MPRFDEHAAHLPPPRADEPANLRREIIDELSDHLTCARRREQLAGGAQTEEAIQHRILDRFGDPVAVARKLWLDWMWEKIMTQRILVGVCILLAVVTCAALAFAWVSINRQQDLIADLQLTSQAQLEEQQKQFERLLVAAQNNKAPSDWNPVELRFVKGKEDGPPMAGMNVNMSIRGKETGIPPMEGVSDAAGLVRFERVRYGSYTLTVRNSVQESLEMWITLQPGQGLTRTIVCPESPTAPANIIPRIEWPLDLKEKPLWFRYEHNFVYRPVAGKKWQPPTRTKSANEGGKQPLIAPNGSLAQANWRIFEPNYIRSGMPKTTVLYDRRTFHPMFFNRVQDSDPDVLHTSSIDWPGIEYRIPRLEVLHSDSGFNSFEEITAKQKEYTAKQDEYTAKQRQFTTNRSTARFGRRGLPPLRLYFNVIALTSADWSYRIEPGTDDKADTLWLTPTAEAIEKVRAALAEIDQARDAAEKAQAEAEKARAESAAAAQENPPGNTDASAKD